MTERNEKLGMIAKDRLTGFTGTVTAVAQYITGCIQYFVTPKCKEGDSSTYSKSRWFDENRLDFSKGVDLDIETEKEEDKGAMDEAPIK